MSSNKKYLEMFPEHVLKTYRPGIMESIEWARENLVKNDRIVWHLKNVKYDLFVSIHEYLTKKDLMWAAKHELSGAIELENRYFTKEGEGAPAAVERYLSGDYKEYNKLGNYIDWCKENLSHFLVESDMHDVKNHVFGKESPTELFAKFDEYETKWQEKNGMHSTIEAGERALELADGGVWFLLDDWECKIEGRLMGHCGNGGGDYSDKIYSLRYPDPNKEGHWIPAVTAIMNGEADRAGTFGEIKGRFNERPNKKYNEALMELIKSGIMKRLVGGGYKSENNFSLDDLSKEQKIEVIKYVPEVFTAHQKWELADWAYNSEIEYSVLKELEGYKQKENKEGQVCVALIENMSAHNGQGYLGITTLKDTNVEMNKYRHSIEIKDVLTADGADLANLDTMTGLIEKLEGSTDFHNQLYTVLGSSESANSLSLRKMIIDSSDSPDLLKALSDALKEGYISSVEASLKEEISKVELVLNKTVPGSIVDYNQKDNKFSVFMTPEFLLNINKEINNNKYDYNKASGSHLLNLYDFMIYNNQMASILKISDMHQVKVDYTGFDAEAAAKHLITSISELAASKEHSVTSIFSREEGDGAKDRFIERRMGSAPSIR